MYYISHAPKFQGREKKKMFALFCILMLPLVVLAELLKKNK